MLCERCRQDEATEHFSEVTDTSIRMGEICHRCYLLELGPVPVDEVRAWMSVEATLEIDFRTSAQQWTERPQLHKQVLPPDVQAFVDRHLP